MMDSPDASRPKERPTTEDWVNLARAIATSAGPPPEGIPQEDWARPEMQVLEAAIKKCSDEPTARSSVAMRKRLEELFGIALKAPSIDTSGAASSHDVAIDSDKLVNDIEGCFSSLESDATCNRERKANMKKLLQEYTVLTKRQRTDGSPSNH